MTFSLNDLIQNLLQGNIINPIALWQNTRTGNLLYPTGEKT